jgi:hypothetical protein
VARSCRPGEWQSSQIGGSVIRPTLACSLVFGGDAAILTKTPTHSQPHAQLVAFRFVNNDCVLDLMLQQLRQLPRLAFELGLVV